MMDYEGAKLSGLLRAVRRRRRVLLALRGGAVSLCVGALSLLLLGWAAHRYRQSEATLLALRLGALAVFLATAYLSLVRPLLKRIGDARLARWIEERTPDAGDRLVTAVEFSDAGERPLVSLALVNRLVADAEQVAASVRADEVVARRALLGYGLASLGCLLLFAAVLRWGPGSISQGVAQLVTPSSLASSNNSLRIHVKPGTARVPKGSDQEIMATLNGFDTQQVTLFSRPVGAGSEASAAAEWQAQAMEPGKEFQRFQFSIFNIQESVEYYVEANQIRTEVFRLDVADLPFVKQLDLLLTFPVYTRIAAKTVEDGGDIAALKGTVATVTARLSAKARAARLVFADGRKVEMRAEGSDFVGSVTIAANTSYYVELVSTDGEAYRGSNEYDITVLEDMPPTITFERPGRDTKATNLEEVFTQARAEDDYGVSSIEMFFSVNGGQEQKINLQELSRDAARSLTAAHTFFLEELKLKPGDFISYYARARDAANETTSDIYFIEVKPFEMQYKQSQQQGGGGGEGGGQDQNALTRRQKELIAATHRLTREGARYAPQERADAYETVAAGQEKLRTDTLEFLDRLGRRLGEQLEGAESLSRMAEHLRQAAREMEGAPPPLRKQAGRDALPPEQRALQQLLSADAIFRELQVAFGNQQGGGAGGERESRELTDLFELELDKMKNQYETLQREQREQSQRGKSEAERKLEELARRQQQALEGQRRQQAQARNGGSSGSGGNERQQQELIEETRRAARELERLSRERRDAQLQELSRQLNQAANEMQQSQSSSQSNSSEAIAQGQRALERLEQARRSLQQGGSSAGSSGRQQEVAELRRRAAEAAARQREIAKDVESLARRGAQGSTGSQDQATQNARQRLGERKGALADAVGNLEQDMEQRSRALGASDGRAARQLSEAANSLRRDRVAERIREGQREVENNRLEAARAGERSIERSLNELSERLQAAEQNAGRSANASNGEETLEQTRRLADNLESLRRRIDENNRRRDARAKGEPPGQQSGGQSGRQSGQQSGQQGSSAAGQQQQESAQGGGEGEGDARQLGAELRQRLSDAADLRRAWGASGGVQRELDRAIEELRRMADGSMRGDAQTAASLKSQVIDPLRQLELELSRRLREQAGRTNLRLGDEGNAPERYRRSVEEYYRRLSGGGQR